jgi:hypothetical protein
MGALKNFHVFLKQVNKENREQYLKYILPPNESTELEWRTKYILANNLGKYCLLYDQNTVYETFLPIFFRFCFDPVAKVA